MKEIIELLKKHNLLITNNCPSNLQINDIAVDSRKVSKQSAFICIVGYESDGHNYINQAISAGAKLIVSQKPINVSVPNIVVTNTRKAACLFAKHLFGNPSAGFTLIGVTGTNGKTTTAWLIEQLLSKAGYKTGLIGTLGYKANGKLTRLERTTPDIIELNEILLEMKKAEVKYVVMEVSSHSVVLDRIFGLEFDAGIFLNLSRDHLDFHSNMDEYFEAKLEFLKRCPKTYVNTTSSWGKKAFDELENSISFFDESSAYACNVLVSSISGTSFVFDNQKFKTKLIGEFNLENLTAAILACKNYIIDENLFDYVLKLEPAQGRMQVIENCVIDYAHTPQAVESVLQSLSKIKKRRIITVCGAGGNRDKGKRPLMAQAACKNSDCVIFTSDNPRDEQPEQILFDMTAELNEYENWWVITDRSQAIKAAIAIACTDDIIVIAGKGHEAYQEVKGVKHYFDDAEEVKTAIANHKLVTNEEGSVNINLCLPIDLTFLQIIFKQNLTQSMLAKNISTDSRQISPNSLFIPLKGENFDGHKYLEKVLEVNGVIALSEKEISNQNVVKVDNTLKAYQLLARRYANMFCSTKIAITGSYGKTTTKNFLANILKPFGVLKTYKNENNQVGVPKTIFRLTPKHNYSVIELGTNMPGEIAAEAFALKPDYAIITSIGASHLEQLKSIEGVKLEKESLLNEKSIKAYIKPDKNSFVISSNNQIETFGVQISAGTESEISFDGKNFKVATDVNYLAKNAALAAKMANILEVDDENIQKGLMKDITSFGRMEKIEINNIFVIADYYNANPASMKGAISFYNNYKPELPHFAVLGDMLELGTQSIELHKTIAGNITNEQKNNVYCVGNFAHLYGGKKTYKSVDELINSKILDKLPKPCVLLLKASRGIHLEKIIKEL